MSVQGVLREQTEAALAATTRVLEIQYTGGTQFFDALDEELRKPVWFRPLLLKYMDEFPTRPRPVVSGRFGLSFASWLNDSDYSHYVPYALMLPGGLRHSELPPLDADMSGMDFAFLDDSYYRGRTYNQIKYRIEECGGRVLGGAVLYDGSPTAPQMASFFRYHA